VKQQNRQRSPPPQTVKFEEAFCVIVIVAHTRQMNQLQALPDTKFIEIRFAL
jgi:hypothetical protein